VGINGKIGTIPWTKKSKLKKSKIHLDLKPQNLLKYGNYRVSSPDGNMYLNIPLFTFECYDFQTVRDIDKEKRTVVHIGVRKGRFIYQIEWHSIESPVGLSNNVITSEQALF
jgi:hypothetical protein